MLRCIKFFCCKSNPGSTVNFRVISGVRSLLAALGYIIIVRTLILTLDLFDFIAVLFGYLGHKGL